MKTTEARKKMCPWIFMSYFMPGNIRGETPCNSCCQADHCMAWRWHHEDTFIGETVEGIKILTNGERMMSETDGYCGLAGKEGAE